MFLKITIKPRLGQKNNEILILMHLTRIIYRRFIPQQPPDAAHRGSDCIGFVLVWSKKRLIENQFFLSIKLEILKLIKSINYFSIIL